MEARTTLILTVWLLLRWKNGLYGYGEVVPVPEGPGIGVATCAAAGLAAWGEPSTTSLLASLGRVKWELVWSGKKARFPNSSRSQMVVSSNYVIEKSEKVHFQVDSWIGYFFFLCYKLKVLKTRWNMYTHRKYSSNCRWCDLGQQDVDGLVPASHQPNTVGHDSRYYAGLGPTVVYWQSDLT